MDLRPPRGPLSLSVHWPGGGEGFRGDSLSLCVCVCQLVSALTAEIVLESLSGKNTDKEGTM